MTIKETIRNRTSVRTYKGIPLTLTEKEAILSYLESEKGVFDAPVRFGTVESNQSGNLKLGTYGVIKDAKTFVVAAVEEAPYNMEELGYRLEKGILYATKKGFSTCWLGGTFNRKDFGSAIQLKECEHIPAITPIGMGTDKRRFVDQAMRTLVGATTRKPWETLFFEETFTKPLTKEAAGKYADSLEMIRLGPSASNKQPWRIVKSQKHFHFYLAHTKNYPITAQRMDLGIAMCHFEMTAMEDGLSGAFEVFNPEIEVPEDVTYVVSWKCNV